MIYRILEEAASYIILILVGLAWCIALTICSPLILLNFLFKGLHFAGQEIVDRWRVK